MARLDVFFHVLVAILALVAIASSPIVQASNTVKDSSIVKESTTAKNSTTVEAAAVISGSSGLANGTNFTVTSVRPTPPGMNFICDDRDVSDKYYFQFNEANLYCSNTLEWYANWTISKQTEPEWSIGEWKAFSGDFADDYNLDCSAARATCLDTTTRWELQRIHPGPENRELVRRIFFVFHLYSLMHDYENNMEVCSTDDPCRVPIHMAHVLTIFVEGL